MKAILYGAAALLAAASVQAYDDNQLRDIGEGRGLFLRHCASCHGADARGAGPRAAACSRPVPDLTALPSHGGRFDRQHVQSQIRYAGGAMPAWGRTFARSDLGRSAGVAARNIWLLTDYLEFAQAPGATVADRPAARSPETAPEGR